MTHDRRTFLRTIGAGAIGAAATTAFAGTASAATVITVEGGGADIWGTEDAFHYHYAAVGGDFDVTVHNTELEDTDAWAKAGLMIRESLEADAANAMLRRNPAGEASLQWRPDTGADSSSGDSIDADWLRLTRSGDTVAAYGSDGDPSDGSDWTHIADLGADEISLSEDAFVGLAVTSHNEGTLCTATFKDLDGISPTTSRDIGAVDVDGRTDVEEDVPFVSTRETTDATATSATLRGELTDLGGAESAEAYVEYREVPTESWERTSTRTLTATGPFSVDVSNLTSRRYYEARAGIETSDGDTALGSTLTFATSGRSSGDAGDAGPSSASHFDPDDGFAEPAPWLDDDTPVVTITEPTRRQLKAAVDVDGPRLIVFETSGTIDLKAADLVVRHDECYVAGQTAPSPGITLIRGGFYVGGSDCVVQHLRSRPGDAGQDVGWEPDAINTQDETTNNVVDHCTATWSVDECLSVGYDTRETTVSNCLVGEGLWHSTHSKGEHSYGTLVGDGADDVALLGNVWAHNISRNPRLKADTSSVVVNNVSYHFDEAALLDSSTTSTIEGNAYLRVDVGDANIEGGRAYVHDNYTDAETPMAEVDEELDERPLWPDGLEALSSEVVVDRALANAGARPADRTRHDERLVRQLVDGTGEWIDSQEDVGGYPDLPVNTRSLSVPESGTRAWLRQHARRVEIDR